MRKAVFYIAAVSCAVLAAGQAYAARPVARWDVVPHQRIAGVFNAGVVAFHEDGVKVTFDVGGRKFTAEEPKLNARTGVWEYFVPIDAAKLPDGPVAVKAVATTLGSAPESFELPELPLYANAKGTQGSKAEVTIGPEDSLAEAVRKVGEGGTVYLRKGVYSLSRIGDRNAKFWTTIAAAPGTKREEVEFSAGRPGGDKLRFRNVTLFCDAEGKYASIIAGENGATCCWLDECTMLNKKGRWACNANVLGNRMRAYVTGGETKEMSNGPGATLQRGHYVHDISSDVWTGSDCLVVNCRCDGVDPGKTGAHPDFHQSHAKAPGWVHDVILYNVSGYDCRCQGLFGIRLRDSAFVNVSFKCDCAMYTQYSDDMENVLFAHITLVDQTWLWREAKGPKGTFNPKDVRVVNCVLRQMGGFAALANGDGSAGLKVWRNAFYGKDRKGGDSGEYGSETARAERPFADEAHHNYALRAGSPALKHGVPLQCVPADINGNPYPRGPRPCGAYAK